jgi:hypothetical protein
MPLTVQQREAQDESFSPMDYGARGDQRPYQIVRPTYPAPAFLERFSYLEQALRECQTLCVNKGTPFRLVRWGARIPCRACGAKIGGGSVPSYVVRRSGGLSGCGCNRSRGPRLTGYPDAEVVADVKPGGQTAIYAPNGRAMLVGAPNYVLATNPLRGAIYPSQPPMRYLEAVETAQRLASRVGQNVYLCSRMGCKGNGSGLVPVVYVQPGGVVRATPLNGGPANVVTPVSQQHFRELVMRSQGGSYLPAEA